MQAKFKFGYAAPGGIYADCTHLDRSAFRDLMGSNQVHEGYPGASSAPNERRADSAVSAKLKLSLMTQEEGYVNKHN